MSKEKIDMKAAGQIMRKLRGIRTKTGVSRELDIPYSTYSSYEAGTRTPSGMVKEKLANYYGTTVNAIFFATNNCKNE